MNDLPTSNDLYDALAGCADADASIRIALLASGLEDGHLAIVAVPGPDEPLRVGDVATWADGSTPGDEFLVSAVGPTHLTLSGTYTAVPWQDVRVVARAVHVPVVQP